MATQDQELKQLVDRFIPRKDKINLALDAIAISFLLRLFSWLSIGVAVPNQFWSAFFAGLIYVIVAEVSTRLALRKSLEWATQTDEYAVLRFLSLPLLSIVLYVVILVLYFLSLLLAAGLTSLTITGLFGSILTLIVIGFVRGKVHKYWERTGGRYLTNLAIRLQAQADGKK